MNQELIVHQSPSPAMIPYSDIAQMGRVMAASKLFGIQNEQQAIALMLLCQSENMHPAVAMRDFHIISGRPALKADAMLARFKAAGGRVRWNEYTDECVSATFTAPDGDTITVDWTPERVKKAQLGGNSMHSKFPRQMLKARCISEGIRAVYPGVLSGLYAPEEMREYIAPVETSGPALRESPPEPAPWRIPDDLVDALWRCTDYAECKVWLAQSRQTIGITDPGDPRYLEMQKQAAARVKQLADQTITVQDPAPEPELETIE